MRLAVILLVAAACGGAPAPTSASDPANPTPPSAAPHEPVATIERTECHGFCPVYKITIYRDGAVAYVGTRHVKVVGPAAGRISADQLTALDHLFTTHGYLALEASYTKQTITDMPSVKTSYAPPGQPIKSVDHYRGDRSAPESLTEIENGIDDIVHTDQWIGTAEERRAAINR